jgi:hypothetical protein
MQPDPDKTQWQQPTEQLPQAPYAPVADDSAPVQSPPVTMSPNQPTEPLTAVELVDNPTTDPSQPEPESSESAPEEPVHWQAHEYLHHEKSPLWFVVFGAVVLGLMTIAIFVMQAVTFAILVPVMAAALIVYSYRPPRILNYTLSRQGLHINDRLYPFADFKGFGVIRDGKEYSVMLLPTKRFQPGVSVYFPEDSGEAIVDMLGARLPMQELHLDIIDTIIRKLRI